MRMRVRVRVRVRKARPIHLGIAFHFQDVHVHRCSAVRKLGKDRACFLEVDDWRHVWHIRGSSGVRQPLFFHKHVFPELSQGNFLPVRSDHLDLSHHVVHAQGHTLWHAVIQQAASVRQRLLQLGCRDAFQVLQHLLQLGSASIVIVRGGGDNKVGVRVKGKG